MFIFISLLLILLFLSIVTNEWELTAICSLLLIPSFLYWIHRLYLIRKIHTMSFCEKYATLQSFIQPFGYRYIPKQDIFTSTLHPWQRSFGYGAVYDRMAPHFGMIFDALPVYFNYNGRTWLIELWKGQYGINTGAEIGIYHADTILSPEEYSKYMFEVISDKELLGMHLELTKNNQRIASLSNSHWWLTTFRMGTFSRPEQLFMKVRLTFPDFEMLHAFVSSLTSHPNFSGNIYLSKKSVLFSFPNSAFSNLPLSRRLYRSFVQLKNQLLCKLFLTVTAPFDSSADRLLYLYYYAPFAFRHTFAIHQYPSSPKRRRRQ